MRFKPTNPNPSLPCLNTIYVGAMGSGKSQCLKANATIPKVGSRVVVWDHAGDHGERQSTCRHICNGYANTLRVQLMVP